MEDARWLYHTRCTVTDIGRGARDAYLQLSRWNLLQCILMSWLHRHGSAHTSHALIRVDVEPATQRLPGRMIPVCQWSSTYMTDTCFIWYRHTPPLVGATPSGASWSTFTTEPQIDMIVMRILQQSHEHSLSSLNGSSYNRSSFSYSD
jgi:hypothetical protein